MKGNYKQALVYKQQALAIEIKLFGKNNADVANSH
jgi:hypothetical protein